MHYSNGRPAKTGDHVIGKGYNLKGPISGIVAGITPGTDTCNVRILTFVPYAPTAQPHGLSYFSEGQTFAPTMEYGQCDHFTHVEDALPKKT